MERPRPLADEVRRRREAGLPGDAAARQQPDGVVAEEPGRTLGRVAGVRVLRQEDDEPTAAKGGRVFPPGVDGFAVDASSIALQPRVQGGQQQRQGRLRNAGARRQRLRKLGEALELDELPNERVEYRTVHDDGRNRWVPPTFDGNEPPQGVRSRTCAGSVASGR